MWTPRDAGAGGSAETASPPPYADTCLERKKSVQDFVVGPNITSPLGQASAAKCRRASHPASSVGPASYDVDCGLGSLRGRPLLGQAVSRQLDLKERDQGTALQSHANFFMRVFRLVKLRRGKQAAVSFSRSGSDSKTPSDSMSAEEATFDDAAGFKIFKYNKAIRWLIGHRQHAVGPVGKFVMCRRLTFGLLGCLFGVALLAASVNGFRFSLAKQDLKSVTKNLVLFSTSVSMLQKYFVFMNQETGIARITSWMMRVKRKNERDMVQPTKLEVFLRRSTVVFYYGGNLAPWILSTTPLLHGEEYSFKFPFVDNSQTLKLYPLILASHVLVTLELIYDAACLLNMLITFRSELHRLSREWACMTHSDGDENLFEEQLKRNVGEHVELLVVFKDLKNFNNSMFGYQVFATLLPTCAMIYGCSKDAKFLREAVSQVLPIFLFAILEFALLCWLGEEVQSGFQEFHRAVHMTNWYETNTRCKRALTVILEFSKKPQELTGFTVIKSSLDTFVETMKQSFSLFTIMQAIG